MSTHAEPAVVASVIMCAYNEEGVIGEQLAALAAQRTDVAWELLVVDNGSTDGTAALVERWMQNTPHVTGRLMDGSARRGPAFARNLGAARARGQLLLFCDADDRVTEDWVQDLVTSLRSHPVVGGRLKLDALNTPDLVEARRHMFLAENPVTSHALPFLPYVISANMGYRAEAWKAVGGMDESFPFGEDVDLSWRTQLAGFPLASSPGAVDYRLRADEKRLIRQQRQYGQGEYFMRQKYPDRYSPLRVLGEYRIGLTETLRAFKHRGTPRGHHHKQVAAYKWGLVAAWRAGRRSR